MSKGEAAMIETVTIDGPTGLPFHIPGGGGRREQDARVGMGSIFGRRYGMDADYSYLRVAQEAVESILDLGVNLGAYTVWACLAWWPGQIVRVHAYDPNPVALPIAKRNCAIAGLPVEFTQSALGVGDTVVFYQDEDLGSASTYWQKDPTSVGVQAAVVRAEDLPPADVLKADIEGSAHHLAGYRHWGGVKVCAYESHHALERDVMAECCRAAGLRMVRGNPDNPVNDSRVWVRAT